MPGVVAHVPNAGPKFVPISTDILTRCATEVVAHFRRALCLAIGLEEDDDFRLLYAERDLCEGDGNSEDAFKKQLESGKPCVVRVLYRLLGGKGGFGALLKKQANRGKKTNNFDAMRDLTGRRLRHSYAVDRIKEWMEKKNKEDELVNMIVGEGPEMPKPAPANESLDPEFVLKLKRSAAALPAVVNEGMRARDAEEAEGQELAKRARTAGASGAAGSSSSSSGGVQSCYNALEALGELSSPSPDADASPDGESEHDEKEASDSVQVKQSSAAAASAPAPITSASSAATNASKSEPSAAAAATAAAGAKDPNSSAAAAAEATAPSSNASILAEAIAESFCAAAETEDQEESSAQRASSRGPRSRGNSTTAAMPDSDGATEVKCIGPGDLKNFASATQLAAKVSAEALKQSLQKLGLKCGGTPEDRAKRLFLLKSTPLEDIPKKEFAKS